MDLILERIAKQKTYTIGRLYILRQVMDVPMPLTKFVMAVLVIVESSAILQNVFSIFKLLCRKY